MSEEYTNDTLKKKLLEAIFRGLSEESVQASMVAQAINYLKSFPEEDKPGEPGQLSPLLSKFNSGGFQALTKQ